MIDNATSSPGDPVDAYPRPQLRRPNWADLSGPWAFRFDDRDDLTPDWHGEPFSHEIAVPFPPESSASGIGDQGPHRVMWYARTFDADELSEAGFTGTGDRLMLRFGAVDYRCRVWVDGHFVGGHVGGHSPFGLDITDAVLAHTGPHRLVVRVEDDTTDVTQPRGKQDWRDRPHAVWYPRTSGIWQPVWLEAVPAIAVESIDWRTDVPAGRVTARLRLSRRPQRPLPVVVRLTGADGAVLADVRAQGTEAQIDVPLALPDLANGQDLDRFWWTPEHPTLIDAHIEVGDDAIDSYVGLRAVGVAHGRFLLNGHPYPVRGVLDQAYWPQSHLAAPSPEALRRDVETIRALGFNTVRLHQKYEDPRFLAWADRLGLMVWGEAPAAYALSDATIRANTTEWLDIVERDRAHPSVVVWVPFNESWGIHDVVRDETTRHYLRGVVALTRALDPSRPVVGNDGWELIDSDIVAVHDYEADADVIRARYGDASTVDGWLHAYGPAGRLMVIGGGNPQAPVMVTEFGGIAFAGDAATWGYSTAQSAEDFAARLTDLFAAIQASPVLAGFCYTQLTDTWQEANGLLYADRTPKLPVEQIRAIVTGTR
jgi:beta-galactosidase/beta-glucuronidase